MLLELILEFKPVVIQFLDVILFLFGSAFVTLGIVYVLGRMLEILKTDKPRNIIAVLFIYGMHYLHTYLPFNLKEYSSQVERGWEVFIRGSISIVIYVTLCWRLYSRIDSFLDKKIGEDKYTPRKRNRKNKDKK